VRHVILGLAVAALSVAATQALAQKPNTQPRKQSPAASSPNIDEVICKHEEAETGSRIAPHMLCGTRAEWAERLEEDRKKTEEVQRLSLESGPR